MSAIKDAAELQVKLKELNAWMARNEYSAPKGLVADKRREIEHLENALSFFGKEVLFSDAEKQRVEIQYKSIVGSRSRANL